MPPRRNRFQKPPPADADLVATHFQDLAAQPEESEMSKRAIAPPPESEEELTEDLEEEELEDEPEEEDLIVAAPAPAPAPEPEPVAGIPPPPKKSRKRNLSKDHRTGGDRSHVVMGASPQDTWPTEAGLVWEQILIEAAKEHKTARDMYINVERLAISGYAAEPVDIGQIEGEAVEGGETVTPATALREYMLDVFHARHSGPAKYRLDFNWKRGRRIKMGEFRFGHPHEMMQQKAYAQARAQAAHMPGMAGIPPVGMGAMPPQPYAPMPPYMSQPPYASYPPPYYQQPQQPQAPAVDPATMAELSYLRGSLTEALSAAREGRQPNIAPPPPPAVAAPSADQEDARMARVVVGVLQSYGIRPAAAQPAQGAAQSAPVGFGAVVDRAREQLGGLKQVLGVFKEFEKLKEEMGIAGGAMEETDPEVITAKIEDPNSPAFGVRKIPLASFGGKDVLWPHREEDESLLTEWGPRFIAANPDLAMSFLEKAMKVLDQGAFGSLLGRLAQQGGPVAQAAQAMGDRMSNGAGAGAGVGSQPPPRGYPAP
jgi:hypothetical protein